MAATLLKEISKDERERAINRSRRMAESDRLSDLYTAKLEGEIKGKAEIISLLEKGLTLEEIKKTLNIES